MVLFIAIAKNLLSVDKLFNISLVIVLCQFSLISESNLKFESLTVVIFK